MHKQMDEFQSMSDERESPCGPRNTVPKMARKRVKPIRHVTIYRNKIGLYSSKNSPFTIKKFLFRAVIYSHSLVALPPRTTMIPPPKLNERLLVRSHMSRAGHKNRT